MLSLSLSLSLSSNSIATEGVPPFIDPRTNMYKCYNFMICLLVRLVVLYVVIVKMNVVEFETMNPKKELAILLCSKSFSSYSMSCVIISCVNCLSLISVLAQILGVFASLFSRLFFVSSNKFVSSVTGH